MGHGHDNLEKESVIMIMPGDVALSVANAVKFVLRHEFAEEIVYCRGDERMVDRLEDFSDDLQKKCNDKGLSETVG